MLLVRYDYLIDLEIINSLSISFRRGLYLKIVRGVLIYGRYGKCFFSGVKANLHIYIHGVCVCVCVHMFEFFFDIQSKDFQFLPPFLSREYFNSVYHFRRVSTHFAEKNFADVCFHIVWCFFEHFPRTGEIFENFPDQQKEERERERQRERQRERERGVGGVEDKR